MNTWEGLFVETMRSWIDLNRSIQEMTDFADYMRVNHGDQPGIRKVLDAVYSIRKDTVEARDRTVQVLLVTFAALNVKEHIDDDQTLD